MKILFHIDPFDDSIVMVKDRLFKFLNFSQILNASGAECSILINKKHKNHLPDNCLINVIEVETVEIQWEWMGQYHLYALVDGMPESVIESAKKTYKNVNQKFDLIITNTPSLILRKILGNIKILHYELGFINRPPLPIFHQLDPLGYSFRSMLSKYPLVYDENKKDNVGLGELREALLEKIEGDKSKPIDGIYFPLLSDSSWTARVEANGINRIQQLTKIAKLNNNFKIYTNEKPQNPLTEIEKNQIKKLENVILVENKDIFGVGAILTKTIKITITSSPSISLQSIFWGNTYISTPGSTMSNWQNSEKNKDMALASYINKFNFLDGAGLIKVINNCIKNH